MPSASAIMLETNEATRAAMEKEKLKVGLRQLINDEEKDLRVIVVKETCADLANLSVIKEVYDDPTVKVNFGFCAWVTLKRTFNPEVFIQSLVEQCTENSLDELEDAEEINSIADNVLIKREKMEQRDLVRVFNAKVRNNSYLFVINDLSTEEECDCIKKYFLNCKMGSRIIVSTHQVEIASLCMEQTYQVLELEQLSLHMFHDKVMHEICKSSNTTKAIITSQIS